MAHPNMLLRDPIMYRILHSEHHRTGNKWCIYPMYDYAHGESDSIERITHSICTLEFDAPSAIRLVYRETRDFSEPPVRVRAAESDLYDDEQAQAASVGAGRYRDGLGRSPDADDQRAPPSGLYPESIRMFADKVGVAKRDNVIDPGLLEFCVREDLNKRAERRMAVLDPLKVVITNYPEDKQETVECVNNPEDESAGRRGVPFGREIWIERSDFMENPPKKYYRLSPGGEVRLRYAYLIRCDEVIRDAEGRVTELRCTYDPESAGGKSSDGRRVKGVIHWVSAAHAVRAEVRLFDRLFTRASLDDPEEGKTFLDYLNPESLRKVTGYLEPSLAEASVGDKFQFERTGYFCMDRDSAPGRPVFNRTVTLKDSWAKIADK